MLPLPVRVLVRALGNDDVLNLNQFNPTGACYMPHGGYARLQFLLESVMNLVLDLNQPSTDLTQPSTFTYPLNPNLALTARDAGSAFGERSDVEQFASRRSLRTRAQQTPWGASGVLLDPTLSAQEMTQAAGFDFDIGYRAVYFGESMDVKGNRSDDDGVMVHVPDQRAIVNEQTGTWLSQMSKGYVAVQPSEIMGFYHDLAVTHNVKLEAAGVIDNGKILWAYASTGQQFSVALGDKSEMFLLFITSTDGSFATRVYLTMMRFSCFNMLGALGLEGGLLASIRHNVALDTKALKQTFGSISLLAEQNAETMNRLASHRMTPSDTREYFRNLICVRDDFGRIVESPLLDRSVEDYMDHLRHGEGSEFPAARDTAYGALQAVLHRHDHGARRRSDSSRFASIMWGQSAKHKTRALNLAIEMIS